MNGRAGVGVVVVLALALAAARAQAGALPTLASGNGTSCVVFGNSQLWCWGRNDAGQLGDGTTVDRLVPISEGSGAYSVTAGDRNVCWAQLPGWGNYSCAGANEFGQIGDGTTTERHAFTKVTAFSSLVELEEVTAGDTPCATVYGAVGDGGANESALYCWGSNQFGSVGDGTTTDRSSAPPPLLGLGLAVTSGGGGHACAYGPSNTIWCWGNNVDDSLGLGPGAGPMSTVPVQITLPDGGPRGQRYDLAVGVHHNCMIANDATAWCWGLNDHGQLGDGTTISRSTPVQVTGAPPLGGIWVSPSGGFTCGSALYPSQGAYCWGRNDRGQLGDGTTTERHVPGPVLGVDTFVPFIVPGEDHACVFAGSNGPVKCWGANDHGQVGDGTRTDRHTPVQLSFVAAAPAVPATGRVPTLALVLMLAAAGALTIRHSRRRR